MTQGSPSLALTRVFEALEARGFMLRRHSDYVSCKCPAHNDHQPSLTLGIGEDGKALIKCHRGCGIDAICSSIGLQLRDLFDDGEVTSNDSDTYYIYHDEDGSVLYRVTRTYDRRFYQHRYENGTWHLGTVGTKKVLFHLPQLLRSTGDVYIAEGEKDVLALERAGAVATCNPGGALKWQSSYNQAFTGRNVIIVADNDEPGKRHAGNIAAELEGIADTIKIVCAAVGKDAYDHLATHTLAEFVASEKPKSRLAIHASTWDEFRDASVAEPPTLVEGLWVEGAFGFIAGPPKARKTWFALDQAVSMSAGLPFCGFEPSRPARVGYMALEGSKSAIRARLGCLMRGKGIDPLDPQPNLYVCYKPVGMDLMVKAWAQSLRRFTYENELDILFIDVLRAAATVKENDSASFNYLRHNLMPILQDGTSIAMLHHFRKQSDADDGLAPGERMAGSGAIRGALDVGIYLNTRPNANLTRVDLECRDLSSPDSFYFMLDGVGSGQFGGYTYFDSCVLEVAVADQEAGFLSATAIEIATYVRERGPQSPTVLCAVFRLSKAALAAKVDELAAQGILIRGKGTTAMFEAMDTLTL